MRYVLRSAMPTNWNTSQSASFQVSYYTEPRQTKGWRGKPCDWAHAASQKQQDKGLNLRLPGQVFFADTTFSQLLLLEWQWFTKAIAYTARAGHLPYMLKQPLPLNSTLGGWDLTDNQLWEDLILGQTYLIQTLPSTMIWNQLCWFKFVPKVIVQAGFCAVQVLPALLQLAEDH